MIVRQLNLRNYRNYEKAQIVFDPGMNLITGNNAQGKTNLIESLVYLSLTRSHRISSDRQLIREGCEFAEASCTVSDGDDKKISAVIHSAGKNLMINRVPVKRSSEFVGILNTVLFSPDDLGIFTDAPRERRRIVNQEITKISPKQLYALNRYANLLKQKNTLLKMYNPDLSYLDILDEQMIREEIEIIRARRRFTEGINSHMEGIYRNLSDEDASAGIVYDCCTGNDENIEESLKNMYRNARQKDLENHVSSCGIHREDLIFTLNGKNVLLTASQGQKRMVMLAFKLSILEFINDITGKKAVLLLDDVLSELDRSRQKKLIDMIKNSYQCIITCTEIPEFLKKENLCEFYVENGKINRVTGGRR